MLSETRVKQLLKFPEFWERYRKVCKKTNTKEWAIKLKGPLNVTINENFLYRGLHININDIFVFGIDETKYTKLYNEIQEYLDCKEWAGLT